MNFKLCLILVVFMLCTGCSNSVSENEEIINDITSYSYTSCETVADNSIISNNTSISYSQTTQPIFSPNLYYSTLFPIYDEDKVGFIDSNGKYVIHTDFDAARFEVENMIVIKKNGLYGAIDLSGKIVIPAEYDYLEDFSCGLALAKKNNLYGYINKSGVAVIDFKYSFARSFSENVAIVSEDDSSYEFINIDGTTMCKKDFKNPYYFDDFHDGLMINGNCYYNLSGECVIGPNTDTHTFEGCYPCRFSEGVAAYPQPIEDYYENIEKYKKDILLWADRRNWLYTFIDTEGKPLFEKQFEDAYSFSEGLAVVTYNGQTGCINKNGDFVFYCDTVEGQYSEGFVLFSNESENSFKFGFLNKDGEIAIPAQYDDVLSEFRNGLALVALDDTLMYIDYDGNVMYSFKKPDYEFWKF